MLNKSKHKHLILLGILLFLTLVYYQDHLSFSKIRTRGDLISFDYHHLKATQKILLGYRQFPHWAVYLMSGNPMFANPQHYVFSYPVLFLLFLPTEAALNLSIILTVFIAGASMYYFMIQIVKIDPKYAIISALVYMFNSYMNTTVRSAIHRAIVIALLPLLMVFYIKAYQKKEWVKYSVISALILALQFHAGGLLIFIFLIIPLSLYTLTYFFGKNIKKRIFKAVLLNSLILILFFGLISIKMLPLLELEGVSSKSGGFSYEESLGHVYKIEGLKDFLRIPLYPHFNDAIRIGLVSYALFLISVIKIKNKKVLFFWLLLILTMFVAAGTKVYYYIWRFIPGFDKIHHVARSMYLFGFAASALAGIGCVILFSKLDKIGRKKISKLIYILIMVFLIFELLIFEPYNYQRFEYYLGEEDNFLKDIKPADFDSKGYLHWKIESFKEKTEQNKLLQYIKEDNDIFRIDNYKAVSMGRYMASYAAYMDLQILYGSISIWIPEYFNEYLGIGWRDPPKFWGMLNTKYIYNDEPLNISEFEFIKKFEKCEICYSDINSEGSVDGPYLYLNKEYLPRAYIAKNSVLVIGEGSAAKEIMYALMLEENFDPSNTVIILKTGSINQQEQSFLNNFKAIILTQGSIDQSSMPKLQTYVDNGGILLPNVIAGENSISNEQLINLLSGFSGDYNNVAKANITFYSPNKIVINANQKGFLVLSEKFFMFEGWKAKINKKNKEILRANGINSAILVEEEGDLTIQYKSKSFIIGMIISIVTLMLVIVYFSYNKKFKKIKRGLIANEQNYNI